MVSWKRMLASRTVSSNPVDRMSKVQGSQDGTLTFVENSRGIDRAIICAVKSVFERCWRKARLAENIEPEDVQEESCSTI